MSLLFQWQILNSRACAIYFKHGAGPDRIASRIAKSNRRAARNRCHARDLCDITMVQLEARSRRRRRSLDLETCELAMHQTAGAYPLHNLLANIAALSEVQRSLLAGLLRQVALTNISPEARTSAPNPYQLIGVGAGGLGASFYKRIPQLCAVFSGYPYLELGDSFGIQPNHREINSAPALIAKFEELEIGGHIKLG